MPYLPDEPSRGSSQRHMVRGSVFVECSFMYRAEGDPRFASVGEVEYVNALAPLSPAIIMGRSARAPELWAASI